MTKRSVYNKVRDAIKFDIPLDTGSPLDQIVQRFEFPWLPPEINEHIWGFVKRQILDDFLEREDIIIDNAFNYCGPNCDLVECICQQPVTTCPALEWDKHDQYPCELCAKLG